jgi:membrane protease subunit (stomatin/prohibitin family)
MPQRKEQSTFFRGIYEFEDPSGNLLAAKVPYQGTADLYDGTVVVVRLNQCAIFVYKGSIAELFADGTHELSTSNVPVLTRLANWRLGFQSPLRCELWFFSGSVFGARRWGTPRPIVHGFKTAGTIPVRAYGQFNLVIKDPQKLLLTLVGSRSSFDITEAEEIVQGQIAESFPEALAGIETLEDLGKSNEKISTRVERLTNGKIEKFGLKVLELQVFAVTPPDEVLKAMNEKAAMNVIGNKREYLLYQAAASLAAPREHGHSSDPMQMMMGLMLGKGLLSAQEGNEPSMSYAPAARAAAVCAGCGQAMGAGAKFCANCGAKL